MVKIFHDFVNPIADQVGFTGTKPSNWNAPLEYANAAGTGPSGTDAQIRNLLAADTTYYVRAKLGVVTVTIASPCVATLNSHGLQADDPIVFSIPKDRIISTVTIASPAVVTKTAHGLAAGDPITFATTGALPTGITAGTTYFVIATGLATDTFQFSTSVGGAAVNTSGTQSGTHVCYRVGSLPTGITEGQVYYVISTGLGTNSFQFSATQGGAAVNTSGTQQGVFTLATGNDANNGLAATRAGAMLNSSHLFNEVLPQQDNGGFTITIQYADSTYLSNTAINIGGLNVGYQLMTGNLTYPSNVHFTVTGGNTHALTVSATVAYIIEVGGFFLESASQVGIYNTGVGLSILLTGNMEFGVCGGSAHCTAASPGSINLFLAPAFFFGNSNSCVLALTGAEQLLYGGNMYLFGLTGSQFVQCYQGHVESSGVVFDGSFTGKRFDVTANGVIDTFGSGANYFPGTVAGTQSLGGQYN